MRFNYVIKKIVIILVLVAISIFAITTFKNRKSSTEQNEMENKVNQTVKVTTSTEKPVTNDDSFTSIDSDLNNTVILNEDFSDLK